jgi:NTE family protein
VICGTSAGALNAALLAANADDFGRGVRLATHAWGSLCAASVHRSDTRSIVRSVLRGLWAILAGNSSGRPLSLLDNSPLRELVTRIVDFRGIRAAIEAGHLDAVCVTASSYDLGRSVSFFEGRRDLDDWQGSRRCGVRATLGPEHLLASAAVPFIYPPERIADEHFGDGSMQQLAPISPAVQLGADRVFIVGVGQAPPPAARPDMTLGYPSIGHIGGHIMDSVFADTLDADLARLERINQTLELIPANVRERHGLRWRHIGAFVMSPRERLDSLAIAHAHRLPPALRVLLRASGIMRDGRTDVLSYLLTEGKYCVALMRRGYRDAMGRRAEISGFLGCCEGQRERSEPTERWPQPREWRRILS